MSIEVEVGGVYEKAADLTPTGSVIAFAGTTAPSGWLLCDGSAVNRETYKDLYDVVGKSFGKGDGSTTFNLPDLRGQFVRGVDGGSGNDPDASSRVAVNEGNAGDAVGSKQDDAIRNITGEFGAFTIGSDGGTYFANNCFSTGSGIGNDRRGSSTPANAYTVKYNASSVVPTGGDNRPKNIALNYIIKT